MVRTARQVCLLIFAAGGAFLLGRAVAFGVRQPIEEPRLAVGDTIPDVILHSGADSIVRLRGLIQSATTTDAGASTVVALFSPGCATCYGDTEIWRNLANAPDAPPFHLLSCTQDEGELATLIERTTLDLPVWRCDQATWTELAPWALPMLWQVDSRGVILWLEAGPEATLSLQRRLLPADGG